MPKLRDTELRVLLTVLRQTTGWNRGSVTLTYEALKRKTGREETALARSIRSLEDQGLIHIYRYRQGHAVQEGDILGMNSDLP